MLCCSTLIISKKPEHHTQPPKMYGVINVERQLFAVYLLIFAKNKNVSPNEYQCYPE